MKRNKYYKRIVIFLIIITQAMIQSGCAGNRKEIQRLDLVVALGIDLNPDGKYLITMQVLNPASSSTQTQGVGTSQSSGNEVLIYASTGETFYDAVFESSKTMGKVQHFGHTKYIVISDEVAEMGIKPILDGIVRLEEFRLNAPFLVTKGKASDIVSAKTTENLIPAIAVENLFQRQQYIGYRPYSYLLDIVDTLSSETTSSVLAVIELVKANEKLGSETFKLSGTAVFKKDKLIGYLNDKETRGFNWIQGHVEVGAVSFNSPRFGKSTVEILRSSSKITPIVNGDNVTIYMQLKNFSNLRRVGKPIDPVKKLDTMYELEDAEDKVIKEEVNLVLSKAKDELGADIFGFGEKIHAVYPKEWKGMVDNWESIYQGLNINVTVDSTIRATGASIKSIE
jgi:spore germination protein KC